MPTAEPFEVKTHEAMSLRSVNNTVAGASTLDSFLKQVLSFEFSQGIGQTINGKPVQEWLAFGSKEEDSPPQRVQEHFHDPTKVGV